jgi:phosphocarrier protein HPr
MQRTVRVGPEVGLHARPAAAFVAAAGQVAGAVRIGRDPAALVDGKSILNVLTLGARHGDELVLDVEDADALDRLAALVEDAG